MLLAILAAADAPQAVSLLDFDIKSLLAVGAAAVALVGWIVAQNRRLDAKAAAADLDARCRALEAAIVAQRDEVRELLEKKGAKSEVIEHAKELAAHRELLAGIRAELAGIGQLREDLRRLDAKLDRVLAREDR